MTENMKAAIVAVNKWLYFGWNFNSVLHTWNNGAGEQTRALPQFLVETKWNCNLNHMIGKWNSAIQCGNPDAYLTRFYAELDTENRQALIEWVMNNYNGELKIMNYTL